MESFLILLETPPNINLHLDNLALKTGSLFKGVKSIPTGAHYLFYNFEGGTKSGFFFYAEERKATIKKWDPQTENFSKVSTEDEEIYESNIREFDVLLVEYPNMNYQIWQLLACYINSEVIGKIEPISNIISQINEEYSTSEENLEKFSIVKGSLFYTHIPKSIAKPNITPEEITQMNFDKSFILYDLLNKDFQNPENLLGELQFSFLAFLLGDSLESFYQWKNILILLCNCESALLQIPSFFEKFIPAFYSQLQSISQDLFTDDLIGPNFLSSCLRSFLSLLHNKNLPPSVYTRGKKFKKLVKSMLKISEFEMCEDEEAPIIVEI
ncbi:unnamed protein product [Blepharisma stoltei]|uniref:Protein AAR2 homolog n=1 Tax=Blepharisma stoltei TaxID=1481888 RepID=A0AAU9JSY9_9CILI|nr:unnamed protein product [Blepharisma stoltei]